MSLSFFDVWLSLYSRAICLPKNYYTWKKEPPVPVKSFLLISWSSRTRNKVWDVHRWKRSYLTYLAHMKPRVQLSSTAETKPKQNRYLIPSTAKNVHNYEAGCEMNYIDLMWNWSNLYLPNEKVIMWSMTLEAPIILRLTTIKTRHSLWRDPHLGHNVM